MKKKVSNSGGETAEQIIKNDLIIRDLGFFTTPVFETCVKNGAFFLSRLDGGILVYNSDGTQLSFSNIYRSMVASKIVQKEMNVCIGEKNKFPVRCFVEQSENQKK